MIMIKKSVSAVLSSVVLTGAMVAPAMAEISGNIGVTSNYLWRGVTQTDNSSAVSGGLDYAHDSGVFAGVWVSEVEDDTERDFYLGYAGESDGLGYSVMYNQYDYKDGADFGEILVDLSYGQFSGGFAYTADSDVDDNTSDFVEGDLYYYGAVGFDLEDDWTATVTVGYYDFDNDSNDMSYTHYQVDLSKSVGDMGDFTFTVSGAEEESGDDDTNLVVSWSKSF